jgi:hypothetical protein
MRLLLLLGMTCVFAAFTRQSLGQEPKPSLENAFRKWDKGFSSASNEDRVKTLREMLPSKDDIAYLFPKHAEKLWANFEKGKKFLENNVDKIAKEFTRRGEIKQVKVIDVRKDKDRASGEYKRLLAIIPMDVPIFDVIIERTNGSSGGGTYLHLKGRWFWIKDLGAVPDFLDKL